KMEEAWAELLGSRRPLVESGDYSTVYEFELDEKSEAVVRRGLENLEAGLPYVLSFIDEIQGVTVAGESETVSWGRTNREPPDGLVITDVGRTVEGKEPTMFRVACAGDPEDGVAVAALFSKNAETWKCTPREISPKLFYPLPLVGTHELGVPFAIAS